MSEDEDYEREDPPWRVTFDAVGPHHRTGGGWVMSKTFIRTASGEVVNVYIVAPDFDQNGRIYLGDGEIVERPDGK